MMIQTLGLQLFLTAISAVLGAGVLLWLQTKYERVKLLRGLEEEVQQNLYTVGKAGNQISEHQDTKIISRYTYHDSIYRAIMTDSPILYTRLLQGISPIPIAYRNIEELQKLGGINQPTKSSDVMLEFLEDAEDALLDSGKRIKSIQQESWFYKVYSRLLLKENLENQMGMYSVIEANKGKVEEKNWRPSGRTTNEKRENNQPY